MSSSDMSANDALDCLRSALATADDGSVFIPVPVRAAKAIVSYFDDVDQFRQTVGGVGGIE